MPTVTVDVDEIGSRVGNKYTDPAELQNLCFDFGIELDPEEVVEEPVSAHSDR